LSIGLLALWHRSRADTQGLCFVDFKVWHHDQKIALTAVNLNRNKDEVLATLIGRHFEVDGFPKPTEPEVPEAKPLYPEEGVVTYDSTVVSLGQDFSPGARLHGKVYFFIRYGPMSTNTAVLKIKGRVTIDVGALQNGEDALYWIADPDSTPDCAGIDNLLGWDWMSAMRLP
jgi:hypothetical protein